VFEADLMKSHLVDSPTSLIDFFTFKAFLDRINFASSSPLFWWVFLLKGGRL